MVDCIETEDRIEAMDLTVTEALAAEEERTHTVEEEDNNDVMVLDYSSRKVFFVRNGLIAHAENMDRRFQDLPDGVYYAKQMSSGIFLMRHETGDVCMYNINMYPEGYELTAAVLK